MNALITPLLFSRFDTTAPAGLVPASSALALFRFANFAIIYFKKSGSALPVKLAIFVIKKGESRGVQMSR
jgi:hypothetical protein